MDYFQEYSVLFLLNFSFIARQSYLETLSIAQFPWQNKSVRWAVPLDFQTKTRQLGYLGICFHTAEVGGGGLASLSQQGKTQLPNHPKKHSSQTIPARLPILLTQRGWAGRWRCLRCATLARGAAKCPWGCAFLFLRGWCCCVLVSPLFWWKLEASSFLPPALKLPFFSSVVTVGRKSTNWEHKSAFLKKLRQKVSYSCMKELHFISSPPWRELSLCLILPLFLVLAWSVITVLCSSKSLVLLASS